MSARFLMSSHDYTEQYYSVITNRLDVLRPYLLSSAKQRWPSLGVNGGIHLANLIKDVDAENSCVIIAAIFKEMKNSPSALDEYTGKTHKRELNSYISHDDIVYLEDYTSRLALGGDRINIQNFVGGLIIAVLGKLSDGKFIVQDFVLPGPPINMYKPLPENNFQGYVAIISGLELSNDNNCYDSLQILRDIILGVCGPIEIMKNVVRLVIAGNTFNTSKVDINLLKKVDTFLAQIATSIHIDLMPGLNDPTNINLPQQPLHPYLFEHSSRLNTFRSTTNPYTFEIEGIRFLGTSGENVKMIKMCSNLSEFESLKLAVNSRCIAPSAGDTLGCYPFKKDDPLNLCLPMHKDEEFPHVVFAGNCEDYATGLLSDSDILLNMEGPSDGINHISKNTLDFQQANIRLVCIPAFIRKPSITLVNLSTLETLQIQIDTKL